MKRKDARTESEVRDDSHREIFRASRPDWVSASRRLASSGAFSREYFPGRSALGDIMFSFLSLPIASHIKFGVLKLP